MKRDITLKSKPVTPKGGCVVCEIRKLKQRLATKRYRNKRKKNVRKKIRKTK